MTGTTDRATIKRGVKVSQNCSRCGAIAQSFVPWGEFSVTESGVLFKPFGLSFDDLILAVEIIQEVGDQPLTKKTAKRYDELFARRTGKGIGKRPFRRFLGWLSKSAPHEYIDSVRKLVVTFLVLTAVQYGPELISRLKPLLEADELLLLENARKDLDQQIFIESTKSPDD